MTGPDADRHDGDPDEGHDLPPGRTGAGDPSAAQGGDPDEGRTLVYVLSTGRSGSTLLDLVLGTHPALATLGELQLLPFDLLDPAARCGCGEPFAACPFWAPLRTEPAVAGALETLRSVRETRDAGRLLRPRLLGALLTGRASARLRAESRAYGDVNRGLLRAVALRAGGATPVDASKDPYRLWLLARSGRVDLHVLHLVRDPRAVAHSFLGPGTASRGRVARVGLRWTVQQVLSNRLARSVIAPGRTTVIRYEDLASAPGPTMAAIGARLGVDPLGFDPAHVREHVNHAIAGNPMRRRPTAIALDQRWHTELDPATARLVWRLTAPVARRLGYRSAPRRDR